jgi:DNA-binding response OmpR family regulator
MGWILQSVRSRHIEVPVRSAAAVDGGFAVSARDPSSDMRGASSCVASPQRGMTHDTPATILVAEDDATTRTFLADELTADGSELLVVDCASEALRALETKYPDVAILDVGLPDGSGLDVVRRVRAADGIASRIDAETPILMLSGRAGETDRIRAFEAGADDFVAKPFSYPELRWRVDALLRRSERRRRAGRVRVGALELDPASRSVCVAGAPVVLTQTEFALLRVLAAAPTTVHTKDELLRSVWGFQGRSSTRTLDSHACRLRQKLGVRGDEFVRNVWGVGYRLVDDPGLSVGRGDAVALRGRAA